MAQTALHHAAREGDVDVARSLIDGKDGYTKVELDARDMCGRTPLHLAARWGRLNVVKLLIDAGANVQIEDDAGNTPLEVANDAKVRMLMERPSRKVTGRIEAARLARADQIAAISGQHAAGELSEWEALDAAQRVEQGDVWAMAHLVSRAEELAIGEAAQARSMDEMIEFFQSRPFELQQEAYAVSVRQLRKKQKEEKRIAEEQARMAEIQEAEARREKERLRAEKKANRELHRSRKCRYCGQTYTNFTNRGGQCVHPGEWANWGTDSKGKKVEWLFEWTCCKSKQHEGPANGLSICARSEPHEESEADMARRNAKMLKRISVTGGIKPA